VLCAVLCGYVLCAVCCCVCRLLLVLACSVYSVVCAEWRVQCSVLFVLAVWLVVWYRALRAGCEQCCAMFCMLCGAVYRVLCVVCWSPVCCAVCRAVCCMPCCAVFFLFCLRRLGTHTPCRYEPSSIVSMYLRTLTCMNY
jgi:hypothetical protein